MSSQNEPDNNETIRVYVHIYVYIKGGGNLESRQQELVK